jgi:hypothetical protein
MLPGSKSDLQIQNCSIFFSYNAFVFTMALNEVLAGVSPLSKAGLYAAIFFKGFTLQSLTLDLTAGIGD